MCYKQGNDNGDEKEGCVFDDMNYLKNMFYLLSIVRKTAVNQFMIVFICGNFWEVKPQSCYLCCCQGAGGQ